MITKELLESANDINSVIGMRGLLAIPKPASPIASMLTCFNTTVIDEDYASIIKASTDINHTDGSQDLQAERLAKVVASNVSNIINDARNVVNPRIREILDEIIKNREEMKGQGANVGVYVTQVALPDLFEDPVFMDTISVYREASYDVAQYFKDTDKGLSCTPEEMKTLMTTGSPSIDAKILKYIEDTITSFSGVSQYLLTDIRTVSLKELTCLYLYTSGICNGRIEKVDHILDNGDMLNAYRFIRNAAARRIFIIVSDLIKVIDTGGLIVPKSLGSNFNVDEWSCGVVSKNFLKWCQREDNRGSLEALLGYVIQTKSGVKTSYSDLENNPAKFVKIYEDRKRHREAINMTEDVKMVRKTIRNKILGMIAEDETLSGDERAMMQEKLKEALKKEYYGSINVRPYVRDVICKLYAASEDVRQLLIGIDDVLASVEDATLDYAVSVAMHKFIGKWLANQFTLEKG